MLRRGVGLVVLLVLSACARTAPVHTGPPPVARPSGTFLSLSDIHFDPFPDPTLVPRLAQADAGQWQEIFASAPPAPVSPYGQDANDPLLTSALAAARRFAPHPDFILISGDFLAHDFQKKLDAAAPGQGDDGYRRFVQKTLEYVSARLSEAFPGSLIFPALGNNDSFCGDYKIEPSGAFLAMLQKVWRPLLGDHQGSFDQTFPVSGAYSVPHPTIPKHRLIVLNSVFFSAKYQNACGSGPAPDSAELAWLAGEIRDAAGKGERIWLVHHVPPGIDAFGTLNAKGSCASNPVSLWQADDLTEFTRLTAEPAGVVTASFAGHTHMDEFRLPSGGGFIHVTPGLSPLFGNNPGFQVFDYDRASGAIRDVRTYALPLAPAPGPGTQPQWRLEYAFCREYRQPGYGAGTLEQVSRAVQRDPAVRRSYMRMYPVSSKEERASDQKNWKVYWCGISSFTPQEFATCYCP